MTAGAVPGEGGEGRESAPADVTAVDEGPIAALLRAGERHGFGPSFFLGHLAAFVRERCPDRAERLPRVDLHLVDGEVVTICHVIALGPRWVAVAVRDRDTGEHGMAMRTELIPYELIARVSIADSVARGHGVGFDQTHAPTIIEDRRSPEDVLLAAAGRPATT